MDRVYRPSLRRMLPAFIRAASLDIGAAVSLRRDLVETGVMSYDDFGRCFAIARLTPGTNLLAFYAGPSNGDTTASSRSMRGQGCAESVKVAPCAYERHGKDFHHHLVSQ
jgi:hypothetical protein